MRERAVRTASGAIYFVRESGGYFYVTCPSWFGRKSIGSTRNLTDAFAMIESASGEMIKQVV